MSLFLEVCMYSTVIHPQPSRECHFVHSLGKNLFKKKYYVSEITIWASMDFNVTFRTPIGKRVSFIQTFGGNVILIHLKGLWCNLWHMPLDSISHEWITFGLEIIGCIILICCLYWRPVLLVLVVLSSTYLWRPGVIILSCKVP